MKKFGDIITSCSDKNLYRAIRLPNHLDCLLISDANTDKSATSLSVGVGSIH